MLRERMDNIQMIDEINEYFSTNKIKIIKMNHCLSESGFTQFESFIELE